MTYGPVGAGRGFPPMFDNVFVAPPAYRAFLETGHWPDKTVFVLEVRYATSHGSINKDGHFQTDVSGVEALVRDEARFPDKWGFFGFPTRGGQPARTGRPIGKEAGCLACHTANGAVDGTFVQFYPTLLEVAEKKGTLRADFKPFTPSPVRLYHTLDEQGWPAAEKVLAAAPGRGPHRGSREPRGAEQRGLRAHRCEEGAARRLALRVDRGPEAPVGQRPGQPRGGARGLRRQGEGPARRAEGARPAAGGHDAQRAPARRDRSRPTASGSRPAPALLALDRPVGPRPTGGHRGGLCCGTAARGDRRAPWAEMAIGCSRYYGE